MIIDFLKVAQGMKTKTPAELFGTKSSSRILKIQRLPPLLQCVAMFCFVFVLINYSRIFKCASISKTSIV